MGVSKCALCGVLLPHHSLGCPLRDKDNGPGGNPIGLLAAPFVVLAIPFIVVVFPIASITAILVSMGVYRGISPLTQETAAFWLTLFIALIPFLAALNLELWVERFWLYRVGRHLLRVVGVPWIAAQYIIYGPQFFGPTHHVTSLSFAQFLGQIFTRPGVLGTMVVLAWLMHLVGSSFDLSGSRPASWRQFFKPRGSIFAKPEQRVGRGAVAGSAAAASTSKPLELSRKLMVSTGLSFAVGVVAAILFKDYDSAVMVILRAGILGTVVLGFVVVAHHALTRKLRLKAGAQE